jgi:holo-[acyl-carrier protein] synthase
MLSVGVDMIEIARIERAMARHGDQFYKRFFTDQERQSCQDQASRLAGRFAVKEAVGKALGTGIGDVSWTDIEIINDDRGKPELILHNQAEALSAQLGLHHWSISLSHTETHAIGFAVAMGTDST